MEAVKPTGAFAADGTSIPADVTVWSAGFAVHSIAADTGQEVAETGRIVVDRTVCSVSRPNVYAAGDCAYATGPGCRPAGHWLRFHPNKLGKMLEKRQ